jgi:hypothetical protein
MNSKKVAIVLILVLGLGIFGYSQYASASNIGVVITESELLEENDAGAKHNVQLEFDNPSLLVLTAGQTEFVVIADDETIGQGTLEPFTLPPLSKSLVNGSFITHSDADESSIVKISGITKYDVVIFSIDVPFVYYPTEEQAREFIRQ